jgi:hypothetical protein
LMRIVVIVEVTSVRTWQSSSSSACSSRFTSMGTCWRRNCAGFRQAILHRLRAQGSSRSHTAKRRIVCSGCRQALGLRRAFNTFLAVARFNLPAKSV